MATPTLNLANSYQHAGLQIAQADVEVTKNGWLTVNAGELLTYTINFLNGGPDLRDDVTISDLLRSRSLIEH